MTSIPGLEGVALRSLPANLAAEQALLGALLANNAAYDRVGDFLLPEHFHDPVHGRIYEAIVRRLAAGQLADAVTLKSDLEGAGELEDVGGTAYLALLLSAMVGVLNAGEYGRAIHETWHRRQLIDVGLEMVHAAYGDHGVAEARAIQEAAETRLFEVGEKDGTADQPVQAYKAMEAAIDAAAKAGDRPGGLVGLTTGFRELDEALGGWRNGDYILLGARPSMGKTTLALGFAAAAAAAGVRALFVSREMTQQAIGAKLTAGLAPMAADAVTRGRVREEDRVGRWNWRRLQDHELARMSAAARAMAAHDLIIDECRPGTMAALRTRARREKRRRGLGLVVIDYLGLMRVPELLRSDNRTLEVTRLSAECKALARELDVPVVVLSQLNRGPEGREDKRPGMHDLRDSGALEQDADVIAFLHREHYYLSRRPPQRQLGESAEKFSDRQSEWGDATDHAVGRAEVIIAKQRMGPIGTRVLAYSDETVWFSDLPEGGT